MFDNNNNFGRAVEPPSEELCEEEGVWSPANSVVTKLFLCHLSSLVASFSRL